MTYNELHAIDNNILSQKELKKLAEETGTALEDVLSALRWWISQGEANDESFKRFYRVQVEVRGLFNGTISRIL